MELPSALLLHLGYTAQIIPFKKNYITSPKKNLLLIQMPSVSHYSVLNPSVCRVPSRQRVQVADLKRQGKAQNVATNSPMAVSHLFERLTQTQGESDGFFPLPTVSGADAGERFWTSQEVKYDCGCLRVCVCT